jgi:hypothetical protein
VERTRLAPAVTVGPEGAQRFDVQRVRELIEVRERQAPRRVDAYDGDTAAEVFALFAQGVEQVDFVVRLKLHPLAVETMYEKWLAMRGAFVVTREISAMNPKSWMNPCSTSTSAAARGSASVRRLAANTSGPASRGGRSARQRHEIEALSSTWPVPNPKPVPCDAPCEPGEQATPLDLLDPQRRSGRKRSLCVSRHRRTCTST